MSIYFQLNILVLNELAKKKLEFSLVDWYTDFSTTYEIYQTYYPKIVK